MDTLSKRLLTFFIGIPAVIAIIVFLPFYNYLAVNLAVIFFSGIGAAELSSMLAKKQFTISKTEAFILGALMPAAFTLTSSLNFPAWTLPLVMITGAGWVLLSRVFSGQEKIDSVINHIAAGFTLLIYPGFFMYWVIRITALGNAGIILLFLFITFGYDSTAWLSGTLFGKNNRGVIPASPNKSIAGFVGGIIGSVIIAVGASLMFPSLFTMRSACTLQAFIGCIPRLAFLLGLFTGIAAALGDLAESAIKRSCDTKDSGKMMFGRGGVLDSIDSIAVAAPVFYFLFVLFFAA